MSSKWDFIKRDLYKSYSLLYYTLIITTYLLDCNLLNLIMKWTFTVIFLKVPISKNLKLSFFILFLINLYSVLIHITSEVTPGIIMDFIGQETTLPILLLTDIQSLILQLMCLFIYLQKKFYEEPNSLAEDSYQIQSTKLQVKDTFKEFWNYDVMQDLSDLENDTNEEDYTSPV